MRGPARLVAVLGALGVGLPLLANGGTLRVARAAVGAYRVSVYTDPTPPRPDSLDVSVLVVRADDPAPVDGLEVVVTARPSTSADDGRGAEPVVVRADRAQADDPRYYAAKFAPGVSGEWRVDVAVRGPEGDGTVSFEIEVREPGLLDRPWVVVGLALLPLALLAWWLGRGGGAAVGDEGTAAPS